MTQACYDEIRDLIIEKCRDTDDPISVGVNNRGNARKAVHATLLVIGEKCSVVDKVFTHLWTEDLIKVDDWGNLVVDEGKMRQLCRKNHPASTVHAAQLATA